MNKKLRIVTADIAVLTEYRQNILISLLHNGEQTLLLLKNDMQASTVFKALAMLESRGMVEKTRNRTYKLLPKGKVIALMILKIAGLTEKDLEAEK